MGFITHLIFYGIGNWIPNLLFEVYHLPTSYSLLISLVMPLITVPASLFIMTVYDKTNQIARTAVIAGVLLTIAFATMCFTYSANIIYAILMSIIIKFLTQCFCSVSFAYVLMKFKHFINIGSSTLTINALASIGAGVAPFVTGLVMDNYGWKEFYIMLTIITAFTTVVAIIGYIVIKKRKNISDYM
jgi:OPA family glycerol-3-phosphate transporter-like MFS transporter